MASDDIAPKGEERNRVDDTELLNTDARVLAYLRAVMLEFGDDPKAMAVAMHNVEAARARLQRKGPMAIAAVVVERSALQVKRLA